MYVCTHRLPYVLGHVYSTVIVVICAVSNSQYVQVYTALDIDNGSLHVHIALDATRD